MTRLPQGWITALAIVAAVLGAVVQQCAPPPPMPEPPECPEPEWTPLPAAEGSCLISNVQVYDEVLPAAYMTTTTTADRRTSEPMTIDEKIPLFLMLLSLVAMVGWMLWSAYRGKI